MRLRQLLVRYSEVLHEVELKPIGDPWGTLFRLPLARTYWRPRMDLCETRQEWIVKVEIAGLREENVEIVLYQDTLVIEGQRPAESCDATARFYAAEIRHGPFRLEVPIPTSIRPDKATAKYDRGFLTVLIPKASEQP
jgi:HSP20 family molecular chaperone IbpA